MRPDTTTWETLLRAACAVTGDDFGGLVSTLTAAELAEPFSHAHGALDGDSHGKPFTAWGANYVYFPLTTLEGGDMVGYAPRNPCEIAMAHQGCAIWEALDLRIPTTAPASDRGSS